LIAIFYFLHAVDGVDNVNIGTAVDAVNTPDIVATTPSETYVDTPARYQLMEMCMASKNFVRVGVGVAALAVMAIAAPGFVPAPTELPTVTVHHNPT
jgi:hypothetical protein